MGRVALMLLSNFINQRSERIMPLPPEVLQLMSNRRDAPAPLVLLHGVWSTGAWYPQAMVACEPFYSMALTHYGQLLTWADTFHHWSGTDEDRESEFLRIAEEVLGQLPEALAATDPSWLGPRPSVIAHSYGTILIYRFLRDKHDHIVERVLLRGSPLAYTTPFDSLSARHAGVHSLLAARTRR